MKSTFVIGGVASLALVVAFLGFFRSTTVNVAAPPITVGAQASPDHYNPEAFYNEVTFTGTNCASATYTVPALSPRQSSAGNGAAHTTTTVTVSNMAANDLVYVNYNPPSVTGTLAAQGIVTFGSASTSLAYVEFWNPTTATTTAIASGTLRVCYID